MAINPFELLKNFSSLQNKMSEIQAKLDQIRAEGFAGGGLVKITLNGKLEILSVEISDEVYNLNEKMLLQDLIRAAYNDASSKVKDKMKEELSGLTSGLNLPPGFLGI